MSRESVLILLGILVMLSPFLGIPLPWLSVLLPVLGLSVVVIGITYRGKRTQAPETPSYDPLAS